MKWKTKKTSKTPPTCWKRWWTISTPRRFGCSLSERPGRAWIGLSGYTYPHWRGAFYPQTLSPKKWLGYASERVDAIELNTTFYGLKWPSAFQGWLDAAAHPEFRFAVKGSRYITHQLKLNNPRQALANFFASGPLLLSRQAGPFLWQLPPQLAPNPERLEEFFSLLPRTTTEAASLARGHDQRLKRGSFTEPTEELPLLHALEPRHPEFDHPDLYAMLRRHGIAWVVADTAGRFVQTQQVTAPFVYARLHGSTQLYASGYSDLELDEWAGRVRSWLAAGLDVYVFFDNDIDAHAPRDATRLRQLLLG